MSIESNLKLLGITLPTPATPVANYVSFVAHEKLVYISGQLPMSDGKLQYKGLVGDEVTVQDATQAARLCAINVVAQLKAAIGGDLEKVARCIKLGVFVNSAAGFTDHPIVANGASDLIASVFEEKGKHSRAAVGSSSLPFGASVEVEAIFAII